MLGKLFCKKSQSTNHDLYRNQKEYRKHYEEELDGVTDDDLAEVDNEYEQGYQDAVNGRGMDGSAEGYVTGFQDGIDELEGTE